MIKQVLEDADTRPVTDKAVKLWLKKLQDVTYDADNVLDVINYENLSRQIQNQRSPKVCLYFSFYRPLAFRWKMAHKIKEINVNFEDINKRANDLGLRKVADFALSLPPVMETDSITVDPIYLGRQNDESEILKLMINTNGAVISVLPIVGMGGLGKTTLARSVFNHPTTRSLFDERIWVCISKNFDVTTIFKRILEDTSDVDNREAIVKKLGKCLEHLSVTGCNKLVSFPIDLGELPCISILDIRRCRELRSLPKGIGRLSKLTYLAIGGFSELIDFNSFQAALDGIQHCKSLRRLSLHGREHWDSLPYQFQHLPSLQRFGLYDFGIEALPEWFGGLSSLFSLHLRNLKKIRHMPSKEAMQRLTKLEILGVHESPLLEERCREERGSDSERSKISHIPYIDGLGQRGYMLI
ncbi:unnamed protein product [Fraxinus pennsylvanica]|uniref:Uncharacterized protein n=1 Tax=Fraxinus pennsylvanica TaxID=56036 RepID=A0AAD1Z995_9LAMI|nr:unnamed protein product [Fraxinus pennsylvanica]